MTKYFPEIYFFSILEIACWQELGIQKGSNGERVQKYKVLGLFFYNTPLEICIFSMFVLIARRSKYDFWIPDKILVIEKKILIKKIFFRDRKC